MATVVNGIPPDGSQEPVRGDRCAEVLITG
jgi:hypothetical protein